MAAIARASVPTQRVAPCSSTTNTARTCPALSAKANIVGRTQKVALKGKVHAGKASRHVTQMVAAPKKPIPDMKGVARPDPNGRFGKFGGRYVPETLIYALDELTVAFQEAIKDPEFQVTREFVDKYPKLTCNTRWIIDLTNLPKSRSVETGLTVGNLKQKPRPRVRLLPARRS